MDRYSLREAPFTALEVVWLMRQFLDIFKIFKIFKAVALWGPLNKDKRLADLPEPLHEDLFTPIFMVGRSC